MTPNNAADEVASAARFTTRPSTALVLHVLVLLLVVETETRAQSAPSAGAPIAGCVDFRVSDTPARLDARQTLYVEQQSVSPQRDGRVLVAGQPVFLWRRSRSRYELVEQDSLLGMVITPRSAVRALTSPLRGRSLTSVRSIALPDGWWLITFAEIVPVTSPTAPKVLALWAGETNGADWRHVEKLPEVPDSLLMTTFAMSSLSAHDGRVFFTMQSIRGNESRVLLYERSMDRWTVSTVYVGTRSYAVMTATRSHDLLAVVRPDSTEREDVNSLFLYSRARGDSAWNLKGRLVRGFRSPVRDPQFNTLGDGALLSWRVTSEDGREETAWSAILTAAGDTIGPIRRLANGVRLLYHVTRRDRGVWAATDFKRPLDRFQLIVHDERGEPVATYKRTTRYGGMLGPAITGNFVVLIASKRGESPNDPAVISLIRTFPWRCH